MCNKIAPEIPLNCSKKDADEDENQEEVTSKGLGWFTTAIFVGRAGAGIVALPAAVVKCQFYPGLLIVGLMATLLTSTAVLLGKCWEIVLRRFPEYASFHCRKPYAEIAFRAMGPHMRAIISIFVNFSQFGMTTVFLLLSAKNTRDFLIASFDFDIDYCILLILIALFLLPFIQLRSPCSFWPIIIVAMCCSVAAISLICFGILSDAKKCAPIREFPEFSAQNYLNALGTMLFAYGGHPGYPTIQHDMKNPKDFTKSAILGFSIMSFFNYTAICLAGLVYGNSVRDCVLNSIQTQWIQHLANLSIACHCFCSITLLINPVNQELEEYFRIPHEFGWKRILLRSIVLFAVVFVAESVPSFGPVLNLYAGITVAFSAAIFPCLFYLYLSAGEQRAKEQPALNKKQIAFSEVVSRTPRCRLLYCCTLMVLFALIAISATITAANSMFNYNFVRPCYAQFIFPNIAPTPIPPGHSHSATNCCGPFQNISRYGPSLKFCTAPELAYYG